MELNYSSNKLKKQCTKAAVMQKEFGQLSKGLMRRMVELESADDLGQLKSGPGNWHDLTGDLEGLVAGRVSGNWRVLVRPHALDDDCTEVTVESVTDYH